MAKRYRDAPFRSVGDAAGRDDWLRTRRYGQVGYREPSSGETETYRPRAPDYKIRVYRGPIPTSAKQAKRQAGRRRSTVGKTQSTDAPPLVPVPTQGEQADRASPPPRPGQFEFRAAVIAAYGRCAVSGCEDEGALEAAHIVPYVDDRSHRLENALCLRADIHALYDRGLLTIDPHGRIGVATAVRSSEYRQLHARLIMRPADRKAWPHPDLLAMHPKFVRTAVLDALKAAREEAGKPGG